jgi:predicted transcriptional regulator
MTYSKEMGTIQKLLRSFKQNGKTRPIKIKYTQLSLEINCTQKVRMSS